MQIELSYGRQGLLVELPEKAIPQIIRKPKYPVPEDPHALVKQALSQPIRSKTGGSTFKNPQGHKAWELIDKAGLRGYSIGDAQISEKHCNFLINKGNASAEELENLINHIKDSVLADSGIELEPEIKIIGKK